MERAILVGVGGFGRCWVPALTARSGAVEVVGVVEPDHGAREQAMRQFSLPAHRAFPTLGAVRSALDATVVIDSSPFVHRHRNAVWAFSKRLDLLAAKPLGGSLAEARSIVAAAASCSRSVAVVQQMRYFPCFLALRDLLAARKYGGIRAVEVAMALDGRGWRPGMAWRLKMAHPLLLEAAIHHFDLLRWCLSTEIAEVAAAEWNPPWSPFAAGSTVAAILRTTDGIPVTYTATFAPHPAQQTVRFDSGWRVTCDDAVLTVVDGGLFADGAPAGVPPTAEPLPLELLNDTLLDVWLEIRQAGRPAPFGGEDNLRSMQIVDQAILSASTRRGPA